MRRILKGSGKAKKPYNTKLVRMDFDFFHLVEKTGSSACSKPYYLILNTNEVIPNLQRFYITK